MKPQPLFQLILALLMVLMIAALGIEIFFAFFSSTLIQAGPLWLPGEQVLTFLNDSPALENHFLRTSEPFFGKAGMVLALASLLILFTAFRKRKKWGWMALLLVSALVWIAVIAEGLPLEKAWFSGLGILGLLLVAGSLPFLYGRFFRQGKPG